MQLSVGLNDKKVNKNSVNRATYITYRYFDQSDQLMSETIFYVAFGVQKSAIF